LLISGDTAPDRLTMAANAGLRMCHKPLTMEQLLAELARIQNDQANPENMGAERLFEPSGHSSSQAESQLTIPFDVPAEQPAVGKVRNV
jgi:hypothetical protein